jgi:2'-5' RNA ligase
VESVVESVLRFAPFTLELGGAGAFPSARRASVLWLGVRDGADGLATLAASITAATAPLGFGADERPYHPHVTLARSTRTRDLRPLVHELDAADASPAWTVDEVVLFESDTRADGAVHAARDFVKLAR